MSPEAQRIAIAEALGLELLNGAPSPIGTIMARRKGIDWFVQRDWLNDLNACHEMEALPIFSREREKWSLELRNILSREIGVPVEVHYKSCGDTDDLVHDLMRMSAAQRCEAFLRTIGKWQE